MVTKPQDLVEYSDEAAFACDERGVVVAWNDAMQEMLGRRADEVCGLSCCEVLVGFDIFGNPYCSRACVPMQLFRCRQRIRSFEISVRRGTGEEILARVSVTFIRVGRAPERWYLVHTLAPVDATLPVCRDESVAAPPRTNAGRTGSDLTARESDVLRRLANGEGTRQIAAALCVSVHTVRGHIRNLCAKLDVHGRIEAVAASRRRRIL